MARLRARPRPGGLGAYEYWILWSLDHHGGRQTVVQAYDVVWDYMREQFSDRERAKTKDGSEKVWTNETRQAARNMKNDGRLKRTSRTIYEISEKGREWLRLNPVAPRLGRTIDDSQDYL
jgi:hypothetical protein